MWAVILTLLINVQQYPVMMLQDGSPVYMRTTSFRVAIGQLPTKTACLDYASTITVTDPATGIVTLIPEFVYSYTDSGGNPQSVVFQNVTATVNGCSKVL